MLDRSHPQPATSSSQPHYSIDTPRYYHLTSKQSMESDELMFYVLGCAGDGQAGQRKVAKLMNHVAGNKAPSFVILLGDNFYNNGVDSAHDAAFKKTFHDVYAPDDFHALNRVPFFVVMGNHDHNLYGWGNKAGNLTPKKIKAQVMHTLVNENGHVSAERINVYSRPELDLADVSHWNMPSRFYALRYQNIELFFLDSCTYLKDYVRAQLAPDDMTNQANWFKSVSKKHPETTKMVFMHHALLSIGKRAYKFDSHYYLNADDLVILNRLGVTGGYNEMLNTVIRKKQMITIDAFFAAHDHSLYYYLNALPKDPLCQIIAGGGGGSLQNRFSFKQWENVPCFIKENGFVSVSTSAVEKKPQIVFDFYTIEAKHLQFDNQHVMARFSNAALDLAMQRLRECVVSAYENYLDFLRDRQDRHLIPGTFFFRNMSHGLAGAERADEIRNFFNQYKLPSFAAGMLLLQRKLSRWTKQHANSFVTLIDEQLRREFFISYEELLQDPDIILKMPVRKASDIETPKHYLPALKSEPHSAEEKSYELVTPVLRRWSLGEVMEPKAMARSNSDSALYIEKKAYTR